MISKPVRKKIASIVWTLDPEGNKRFLIRHNRPFDGYEDEWTILFGNVDSGESFKDAAIREVGEEYDLFDLEEVVDLKYNIEYEHKGQNIKINFFSVKIASIDSSITLNNESIGYDWKLLSEAKAVMQHDDESFALNLVK